ncbi:hypothetical protein [Embleya sp. AB8]|uniref:hypothetical protein n=1 Tax=Embleya sp. AB8 TaxID=3156304 RepID=UPI003C78D6C9
MRPAISDAERGEKGFVLPAYVVRPHDGQLRERLEGIGKGRHAEFVLLHGVSCSGKSRTAFEAVTECLPDWALAFPKDANSLLALLEPATLGERTVLWLDGVHDYLHGAQGDDCAAALRRRLELPGPMVVLATGWDTLDQAPEPVAYGGREGVMHLRALAKSAVSIPVPGSFSSSEMEELRVAARSDPSLALAAEAAADSGRVTQTLAAAGKLLAHARNGGGSSGVYGRALLRVAMDARCLGVRGPLPLVFLRDAIPGYLSSRERAEAPGDWFRGAVEFGRTPVEGVASALTPVVRAEGMGAAEDVVGLDGTLEYHACTSRHAPWPSETFWSAAVKHLVEVDDLRMLSFSSLAGGDGDVSLRLFHHAHVLAASDDDDRLRRAFAEFDAAEHTTTSVLAGCADAQDIAMVEQARVMMRRLAYYRETNGADSPARRRASGSPKEVAQVVEALAFCLLSMVWTFAGEKDEIGRRLGDAAGTGDLLASQLRTCTKLFERVRSCFGE